jgi:hypothetical protein
LVVAAAAAAVFVAAAALVVVQNDESRTGIAGVGSRETAFCVYQELGAEMASAQ